MAGLLALVGGAEFMPGNEVQDRHLVAAAGSGPAYVVSTAAARHGREPAVAGAKRWFAALGLDLEELPVLTRSNAADPDLSRMAREGGFFYLLGGDPGIVVSVLRESPVWGSMVDAWVGGAVLAGSSAGAMGLCASVLLRASWPGRTGRRHAPGLGLVPGCAVIPHFDTFGKDWVGSAQDPGEGPGPLLLGIDERTAAVWDGTDWRVEGPGTVTVVEGASRQVHASGDIIVNVPQAIELLSI